MHVSKKKLNGRSLVASGRINPFVISYVNYLDLILTYMSLWCDRRDKISQKKSGSALTRARQIFFFSLRTILWIVYDCKS